MKDKPKLSNFITFCVHFVIFTVVFSKPVSAADIERYSKSNPQIKQVCVGVANPSSESERIQSELIGNWTYIPELSDSSSNIAWQSLVFRKDGIVEYSYELRDEKRVVNKSELYKVIHKGSNEKFPGKAPNIAIGRQDKEGSDIILFIETSVNYDSRVPMEKGKVLKFKDMEGRRYCFIKQK